MRKSIADLCLPLNFKKKTALRKKGKNKFSHRTQPTHLTPSPIASSRATSMYLGSLRCSSVQFGARRSRCNSFFCVVRECVRARAQCECTTINSSLLCFVSLSIAAKCVPSLTYEAAAVCMWNFKLFTTKQKKTTCEETLVAGNSFFSFVRPSPSLRRRRRHIIPVARFAVTSDAECVAKSSSKRVRFKLNIKKV